jgi:hypothetical protein
MTWRRLAFGFLLAALAAVPIMIFMLFSTLYLFRLGWFRDWDYAIVLMNVYIWAICATPIGVAVTFLGALPAHLWFRKRGWTSLRYYAILGFVLGVLPLLVFDIFVVVSALWSSLRFGWGDTFLGPKAAVRSLLSDIPVAAAFAGVGASCGVAAAAVFWVVAVRRPKMKDAI